MQWLQKQGGNLDMKIFPIFARANPNSLPASEVVHDFYLSQLGTAFKVSLSKAPSFHLTRPRSSPSPLGVSKRWTRHLPTGRCRWLRQMQSWAGPRSVATWRKARGRAYSAVLCARDL